MDIKEKAPKILGLHLKNQDPFRFYKVGLSHDQSMIIRAFESQRDSMINIRINRAHNIECGAAHILMSNWKGFKFKSAYYNHVSSQRNAERNIYIIMM